MFTLLITFQTLFHLVLSTNVSSNCYYSFLCADKEINLETAWGPAKLCNLFYFFLFLFFYTIFNKVISFILSLIFLLNVFFHSIYSDDCFNSQNSFQNLPTFTHNQLHTFFVPFFRKHLTMKPLEFKSSIVRDP